MIQNWHTLYFTPPHQVLRITSSQSNSYTCWHGLVLTDSLILLFTGDGAILYFLCTDGKQHILLVAVGSEVPWHGYDYIQVEVQMFFIFSGKGRCEKQVQGGFTASIRAAKHIIEAKGVCVPKPSVWCGRRKSRGVLMQLCTLLKLLEVLVLPS